MADDSNEKWGKLIGLGEIAVGVGFFIRGLSKVSGKYPQSLLGNGIGQPPKLSKDSIIRSSSIEKVANIDQRVQKIIQLTVKSSADPATKEEVAKILSRKCGAQWCVPPKDAMAEITAIFNAITDPRSPYAVRYARDSPVLDTFASGRVTSKLHIGDCDDFSIKLGSLYLAAGYNVAFRVIQAKGAPSYSHIYVLVSSSAKPGLWIPVDGTVKGARPGWEAPGAKEVAATGRPSGVVVRLRDFLVEPKHFAPLAGVRHSR